MLDVVCDIKETSPRPIYVKLRNSHKIVDSSRFHQNIHHLYRSWWLVCQHNFSYMVGVSLSSQLRVSEQPSIKFLYISFGMSYNVSFQMDSISEVKLSVSLRPKPTNIYTQFLLHIKSIVRN